MISPSPSVGHVYAQVANEALGVSIDAAELDRRFVAAWKAKSEFDHSRQAWENIVDATFGELLDTQPSQSFFPELYDRFAQPQSWHVFDDVIPALEELAMMGIPLAIISNWDERLRPLLHSLNLSGYFESILISSEVYFAKPSNVIFEHAVRNLGLPAESILHVGDSVDEDVQGAKASGMRSMLLDRAADASQNQISSLRDLSRLLSDDSVNVRD